MAKVFSVTLDGEEYPFFFGMTSLEDLLDGKGWNLSDWQENQFDLKVQTEAMLLGLKQGHDIAGREGEFTMTRREMVALLDRSDGAFRVMAEHLGTCINRVMGVTEDEIADQANDDEAEGKAIP